MSQTCNKCKRTLPIDRFSKQKSAKNGYRKTCKDCHNAYVREVWYVKNADKQKKAVAEYKARNPAKELARKYKVSEAEIQALLDRGRCDICGSTESLHIDHCHDTGKIRGILCRDCNFGLGFLKDNVTLMGKAIEYLAQGQVASNLS